MHFFKGKAFMRTKSIGIRFFSIKWNYYDVKMFQFPYLGFPCTYFL